MQVRTHITKTVAALFGETSFGIVGASLQWLTLAALVSIGVPDIPLAWRLAIAPLGVVTLLAGVMLALRGNSLGPLIAIPAVIGIAAVVLLAAILYPLRMFTNDESREADQAKR